MPRPSPQIVQALHRTLYDRDAQVQLKTRQTLLLLADQVGLSGEDVSLSVISFSCAQSVPDRDVGMKRCECDDTGGSTVAASTGAV